MWELLQSSSQVPFTSICFAKVISCFWLGTTKLITYDWSLWSFPIVTDLKAENECSQFCRCLPVCIGTDVVNEGAVLQDSFHLPQRHVFASLQLHQVLFAVFTREHVLSSKRETNAALPRQHLTDNLEAAVGMKLSDVPGAEPPLSSLVHEKVVAVLVLVLVIAHRYVGAADEDFSSGVGLVCAVITT